MNGFMKKSVSEGVIYHMINWPDEIYKQMTTPHNNKARAIFFILVGVFIGMFIGITVAHFVIGYGW
jgi:hypothetical protein